ncbi:hypothetical protein [Marinobacter litoralis]|uniref:hypothetical protein n=1 Tax=Marinobacter litoralis TaxID=187981 RepID=UPI0018EE2577|nr:hypothetical protein [Marinobacter litoralis]MBJ6138229.1 hypothetical protein [Marinobacter litoralis]
MDKRFFALMVIMALFTLAGCKDRVIWNDNGKVEEATQNREVWNSNGKMDSGNREIWVDKNGNEVVK